jgi:hypothetical protein
MIKLRMTSGQKQKIAFGQTLAITPVAEIGDHRGNSLLGDQFFAVAEP